MTPPLSNKDPGTDATPSWIQALIRRVASPHRVEEAIGDLEEVHRVRVAQRGGALAALLTAVEAIDLALALLGERAAVRRNRNRTRNEAPNARGWRILPVTSRLDFKLGLRMVARYPGLTAVAVIAMAFGIAIGATAFEFMKVQLFPPLPYTNASRIVAIQNVDISTTQPDARALHDFERWRYDLRTLRSVSALHLQRRTLTIGLEPPFSVSEAQVSVSAFSLLRRAPLLGRGLRSGDEAADASPVAVVSYELWKNSFAGAEDIVGRVVRLGGTQRTIVGVMPEGFTFFIPRATVTLPAPQDVWTPLRLRAVDYAQGAGPDIAVIGEMAARATPQMVRTELATLSARLAAAEPHAHEHRRAQILQFARPFSTTGAGFPTVALTLGSAFVAALMIVLCGNIALLLFARAATREREIAIRSALGASRSSIVMQLFAESLVLATLAIAVGLSLATVGLKWAVGVSASMMRAEGLVWPSWAHASLSPATIVFAAALALLGAAVVGILPGLKVTSQRGSQAPQRLIGHGGAGVRLGGVWTGIVVAQVALTAMLVPIAGVYGVQAFSAKAAGRSMPVGNYLAARLRLNDETVGADSRSSLNSASPAALAHRFETGYRALASRLAAEPGVSGVTIARQLPGSVHDRRRFQTDAGRDTVEWAHVQIASVDANFFETFHSPITAGRNFAVGDSNNTSRVVIVNESFVREFLGGAGAVGHRVRYGEPSGPGAWYTIIGVVRDVALGVDPTIGSNAGIYHVLRSGSQSVELAVEFIGSSAHVTARLHELAAEVGPALSLQRVLPLEQAGRGTFLAYDAWFRTIVLCSVMAILLTNAGIYAVISFTVARRTREIGVRVALGAAPKEIISVVLARAARHVVIGVGLGASIGTALTIGLLEGGARPTLLQGGLFFILYAITMVGVCLLACAVPARRALRIQPMVALAAEG